MTEEGGGSQRGAIRIMRKDKGSVESEKSLLKRVLIEVTIN